MDKTYETVDIKIPKLTELHLEFPNENTSDKIITFKLITLGSVLVRPSKSVFLRY